MKCEKCLFLQIMATSGPIEFVHKNDCNCIVPSNNLIHMKIGQVG